MDQWAQGTQRPRLCTACPLPAVWAGACGQQAGGLSRRLCLLPVTEGASRLKKKKSSELGVQNKTEYSPELQDLRQEPHIKVRAGNNTYLHLWNSPLQNAVQTNNLPSPAQMPRTQQMIDDALQRLAPSFPPCTRDLHFIRSQSNQKAP